MSGPKTKGLVLRTLSLGMTISKGGWAGSIARLEGVEVAGSAVVLGGGGGGEDGDGGGGGGEGCT